MGKVKYNVKLTDEEVKEIKGKIRNKKTSKMILRRCQILLDMDENHGKVISRCQCAKTNGVCQATVENTLKKYANGGVEEALSYKRSVNSNNAKRKMDGRAEAKILELSTSPAPDGHARWTLRLLEEKSKVILEIPVSKDTIGRALKKLHKAT